MKIVDCVPEQKGKTAVEVRDYWLLLLAWAGFSRFAGSPIRQWLPCPVCSHIVAHEFLMVMVRPATNGRAAAGETVCSECGSEAFLVIEDPFANRVFLRRADGRLG